MPPTLPEGSVVVVIAIGMGTTVIVTGFAAVRSIRQGILHLHDGGSRRPQADGTPAMAPENGSSVKPAGSEPRHDRPDRRP